MLEIARCICFLFAEKTLLKVTEIEMKEFNIEVTVASRVLRIIFGLSAVCWALVFAYRHFNSKFDLTRKLEEKLIILRKKLIKGFQIRMDEKEFKKVN